MLIVFALRKSAMMAPVVLWKKDEDREEKALAVLVCRSPSADIRLSVHRHSLGPPLRLFWAKSHTMRTDSAPHGQHVSTCTSAASVW